MLHSTTVYVSSDIQLSSFQPSVQLSNMSSYLKEHYPSSDPVLYEDGLYLDGWGLYMEAKGGQWELYPEEEFYDLWAMTGYPVDRFMQYMADKMV